MAVKNKTTISDKFGQPYWTNSHNAILYSNMSTSYFKQKAIEGGLDDGRDVKAIAKYIKNARSILEVGAGYGRALDYIIKSGFKGTLVALEREPKLSIILKRKFKQVHIICRDIRTVTLQKKFDLIVWLWTGLWEFAAHEQLTVLAKLVSHLNNSGFLILDLIPSTCKTIKAIRLDKNNRFIPTPYGNDYTYIPSHTEIKQYAKQLNLQMKTLTYTTKTSKKRILYIFYIANTHASPKERAVCRK